jgi:hypothetical protein
LTSTNAVATLKKELKEKDKIDEEGKNIYQNVDFIVNEGEDSKCDQTILLDVGSGQESSKNCIGCKKRSRNFFGFRKQLRMSIGTNGFRGIQLKNN